jgi:glycosyltransferase involved in cell wall biosynthesis
MAPGGLSGLRVALAHDWLVGMRGGEKVLEVFADLFPDAPIYTMVHKPGSISKKLESHPIFTSPLQKLPMAVHRYRYYLPLMPRFVESMKMPEVDLIVSVSTCVAKSVVPQPGTRHACYINSPMRYLYDRYDDYFSPGKAGFITRTAMRMFRGRLQRWDKRTTDRVDSWAANSSFIRQRVMRYYLRPAEVIVPPVDVDRFQAVRGKPPDDYYLMVTALVPYKNVDVAVEAFRGLDRRLVVAGSGPMFARLKATCPPNVTLLGWVDDDAIPELVARCRAFLMPNVEDFGIAPVEAMAAGRPVIALGEGGVRDTVRDIDRFDAGELSAGYGPTGVFFSDPSPIGLANAIRRFESMEHRFIPSQTSAWTRRFDHHRFVHEVTDWIRRTMLMDEPTRRAA